MSERVAVLLKALQRLADDDSWGYCGSDGHLIWIERTSDGEVTDPQFIAQAALTEFGVES